MAIIRGQQVETRLSGSYIISGSTQELIASDSITLTGNVTASGTIKADAFESVTGGTAITFNDDITIDGNISSSATKTGSFGDVHVSRNIGLDTVTPKSQLHIFRNDSITHGPQNASGGKGILLEQAGSGDAVLEFLTTGETGYIMGIDNSDSDALKITQGQFRLGDGTTHFRYGRTGRLSLLGTDARLGVGSDPGLQFHVEGFAHISNKTRIGNTGGTTPSFMLEVHGDAFITGSISGSATTTGSFGLLKVGDNLVSDTHISSSATSTGSFGQVFALNRLGIGTETPTSPLHVVGDGLLTGDLTVNGKVTAQEFHTEFVSSSIQFSSGSTKFGDTLDGIHNITGSVFISASDSSGLQIDNAGTTVKLGTVA